MSKETEIEKISNNSVIHNDMPVIHNDMPVIHKVTNNTMLPCVAPLPVAHPKQNGGRRAGAGRKKGSAARVREWIIENEIEDAKFAYKFLVDTMTDPDAGKAIQIDCAKEVLNRVLGKSTARIESSSLDNFFTEIRKRYES